MVGEVDDAVGALEMVCVDGSVGRGRGGGVSNAVVNRSRGRGRSVLRGGMRSVGGAVGMSVGGVGGGAVGGGVRGDLLDVSEEESIFLGEGSKRGGSFDSGFN